MPSKQTPEKLRSSFDLLAGLALELDAPLASVQIRLQKLISEYKRKDFEYISYKDFKAIFQTLEQLERQLKRCCTTTGRMIRLNKVKANIHKNVCQVNDAIHEVVGLSRQLAESHHIKFQLRLDKVLPQVRLGPVECHQVINNVLINAIQSMPGGGIVKIKASLDKHQKGFALIDVHDEGVGIMEEHLPKIFDPFFTTKERGVDKSSGLGLSIVYFIVNSIGGTVDVKSSLRQGTHVRLTLPVARPSHA